MLQAETTNPLPPPPEAKTGWPWTTPACDLPDAATAWPRITVVTPSYNQAQFVEETIRSVLLQGYPNLEYIVNDGGSTDGSARVIEKYAPWLAHWESTPDNGQSHAINKGLTRATGNILAWLNSDDVYQPGVFFTIAEYWRTHPDTHFVIGDVTLVDERSVPFGTMAGKVCPPERFSSSNICMPQPASFWSREIFEQCGPLDEDLHFAMDMDFWFKLAHAGIEFRKIDRSLACFRRHGQTKSHAGGYPFRDEMFHKYAPMFNGAGAGERYVSRAAFADICRLLLSGAPVRDRERFVPAYRALWRVSPVMAMRFTCRRLAASAGWRLRRLAGD